MTYKASLRNSIQFKRFRRKTMLIKDCLRNKLHVLNIVLDYFLHRWSFGWYDYYHIRSLISVNGLHMQRCPFSSNDSCFWIYSLVLLHVSGSIQIHLPAQIHVSKSVSIQFIVLIHIFAFIHFAALRHIFSHFLR